MPSLFVKPAIDYLNPEKPNAARESLPSQWSARFWSILGVANPAVDHTVSALHYYEKFENATNNATYATVAIVALTFFQVISPFFSLFLIAGCALTSWDAKNWLEAEGKTILSDAKQEAHGEPPQWCAKLIASLNSFLTIYSHHEKQEQLGK